MRPMQDDLTRVLVTEQQIRDRLDELARDILLDYAGKDLTLVPILTGSVMFIADLIRRLPMQLRFDFLGLSSYHGQTRSSGDVIVTKALRLDVRGRDVLVVDDILDSGLTLARIRELIEPLQPRSLKFCVLLDKEIPRTIECRADYVGFRIPNEFVVGYGLDYCERYRNLSYIGVLKPEAIAACRG